MAKLNTAKIEKLAAKDAAEVASELSTSDLGDCLQPGQLGADEGLINALGADKAARYLGADARQFSRACRVYNAAHVKGFV